MNKFAEQIDRIPAWQCIGCGKLEAPRPCIGICHDRKVQLVNASDYDLALMRIAELEKLLGVLAMTTPHDGKWERSYLHLQKIARRILAD